MSTLHLSSWNVNGIRASAKKGFFDTLKELDPDIICLQETKAQDDQVAEVLEALPDHYKYSNSAEKKGYSGTAIISKEEPLSVMPDIGVKEHDNEGRVLCAEYKDFYFVGVYVPNSGQELKRLDYRSTWDSDFLKYLKGLEKKKPVIACGDFNVAHQAIDLARPRPNYNRSAGYTQVEIDGMDNYRDAGLKDTFREMYPDEVKYSWWSYRANARANNIGWRIDYFLVSEALLGNVKEAYIRPEIHGSDHCPVGIELAL